MSVKDTDYKFWQQWNTTRKPRDLSHLLKQMDPLIHNSVKTYTTNLSPAVMTAEAKLQAVKAFETYNPTMNVQLSTHVSNYLKKLNRLAYKHQELFNVPEARRIKYHTFDVTRSHLTEELGREPTMEEMAERLKWSNAEVARFFSEQKHELSDTQPLINDMFLYKDPDSTMLAYIYNDLAPKDKLLLEHTTGYGGKPILTTDELMRKLNYTSGQLSYAKKNLTNKIQGLL